MAETEEKKANDAENADEKEPSLTSDKDKDTDKDKGKKDKEPYCSPVCLLSTTFLVIVIDFVRHLITSLIILYNPHFEKVIGVGYLILLIPFIAAAIMVAQFFF